MRLPKRALPRRVSLACAAAFLLLIPRTVAAAEQPSIEQLIVDLGFPADATARVRRGEMLEADPTESSGSELAIGLMFLVKQPPAEIAKAFRKAVDLKQDRQLASSTQIKGAGSLADFTTLVLTPDGAAEAKRYLKARPGETLNLSPDEIRAFNALSPGDGQAVAQVEEQVRRLLLARYQSYLAKGLDGIAPYARADGLQEPGRELRGAVGAAAPLLAKYAPAMAEVLRSYPRRQAGRPQGELLLVALRPRWPTELHASPSAGASGRQHFRRR
jgi:hypothetical protein